MEKFKFGKELKEAILIYEDGQPLVMVDGEKRKVRSPVLLRRQGIGEKGVA